MLKKILLVLLFFFSISNHAQQIEWVSMDDALELQKEKPKKIMLFVYAEWCKNCHEMNKNTFTNKHLAKYLNKYFYAVHFNGEGNEIVNYKGFEYTNPNYVANKKGQNYQHFFADALKIKAYPTIVFFDETGEIISPIEGFKTAKDLEIFLKLVATDDYKEVTTQELWENYKKEFKSKFKVD